MRKVTVNFNFEQSSTTERTVKSINLNLGEIIGKSMGFGKWQISITSLLISGLYLGNVHIQIYHKASPEQEKESHDKWWSSETNYQPRKTKPLGPKEGNMDQDPRNNQPPTNHNHRLQYQWLSPLRDIQPGIFSLETKSYPEDNPIHGIDPKLFAERATNTSARTETSTNSGYQTQQCWSNPAKDNQSSIPYT